MHNLLKLRDDFAEKGIIIAFNGSFTHSIIEEIGNAIKSHLEAELIAKGTITDVFAVYVEQTQNVRNYVAKCLDDTSQIGSSVLIIVHNQGKYTVGSGNIIRKCDVNELKTQLETINSCNKDQLKQMHKIKRKQSLLSQTTGAGLGLIDMARRSSGKLDFKFEPVDDDYDFFSLSVKVNGV